MEWMRMLAIAALAMAFVASTAAAEEAAGQPRAGTPGFVVATDFPDINVAIDALPPDGGTVYLPAGNYIVKETINLTGRNTRAHTEKRPHAMAFVRLTGEGRATKLIGRTSGKPVIDMTDSSHCEVSELWIRGASGPEAPDVGIVCARDLDLGSAGYHSFYRVMLDGHFTKACVYQISSEVNRWIDCYFMGTAPYGVYISPRNDLGVESPYGNVQTRGCSNKEGRFIGCHWGAYGSDSVALVIKGWAEDFSLIGCFAASSNSTAIVLDGTEQLVHGIYIDGLTVEAESGRHGLLAKGRVANVVINGGNWVTGREAIRSNGIAENWRVRNLQTNTFHGFREAPGKKEPLPDEGWTRTLEEHGPVVLSFDKLVNSVVGARSTWFSDRYKKIVPSGNTPFGRILVRGRATGNTIEVRKREQLIFAGPQKGNSVQYLDESGAAPIVSLPRANLAPTDVAKLPDPRPGDIAIDDGANTHDGKPVLAMFDGEAWVLFSPQSKKVRPVPHTAK